MIRNAQSRHSNSKRTGPNGMLEVFRRKFQALDKSEFRSSKPWNNSAFTIIELLVVVSIIILLVGILVPITQNALDRAKSAKCMSNLRAIHEANMMYASDKGYYVPAAEDIKGRNLTRWHGRRESTSEPFRGRNGPLTPYLGNSGRIRRCPSFSNYKTNPDADNAFESSCGGYGYNRSGVGSRMYFYGQTRQANKKGMAPDMIDKPAQTVMFCDTAFAQPYGRPEYLIEYSFAEPYSFSLSEDSGSGHKTTPSIHFRHDKHTHVVWCDGHVTAEKAELPPTKPYSRFDINWLGEENNELFDPY